MIDVSTQFLTDVQNDNRNYQMYVDITLADGTVLNLTNSDLWEGGVTIEDSVSDDSVLEVGSTIINQCTVVLNNINEDFSAYDFADARVVISVGLMLTTGTEERFQKGVYTVNEQLYDSSLVTLICLDEMNKFEKPYSESSLVYPATLTQIVTDACNACDVAIGSFSLLNGSLSIPTRPTDTTLTFRDVLAAVGEIACANARINANGRLEYIWYNKDALQAATATIRETENEIERITENGIGRRTEVTPNEGEYSGLAIIRGLYTINTAMDDTVITGVRAVVLKDGEAVEYKSGVDGYYISLENNIFITANNAQTIVNAIAANVIGFTYRKANFTHLSEPYVEAGDVAIIFDGRGRQYAVLISTTIFTVNDRQESVSAGATPARNKANQYTQEVKDYVGLPKPFYTWIAYADDATGTDISTDPTGKLYIGIAENQTTPTIDISNPSLFTWSRYVGANGYSPTVETSKSGKTTTITITDVDGTHTATVEDGDNGVSISGVTNYYLATSASSGVTPQTSGWTTTIQTMTATNQYLWTYEVVTGSDGSTLNTTTPIIIGRYGQNGGKGEKGDTGVGITSITEHYQVSASDSTAPTTWSDTMVNTDETNRYLWNYETINYSDGTHEDTTKRIIGTHGQKGATPEITAQKSGSVTTIYADGIQIAQIADGQDPEITATKTGDTTNIYADGQLIGQIVDGATGQPGTNATIVSQEVTYLLSRSGTDAGDTDRAAEDDSIRLTEDGKTRVAELNVTSWSSTIPDAIPDTYLWTKTVVAYNDGTVVTSYQVSYNPHIVSSVVSEYYLSSLSSALSGGSWSETPAEYVEGYYYWRRDKTTWDDGSITYSEPVLDQSMISANENASAAVETANTANDTANTARQEAADARKYADNYMSSDNTGVMVADLSDGEQTPSTATGRNVRITNTNVEIRDGQTVKASFGEEVILGEEEESHAELDYHSLELIDKDGVTYFSVQDLRDDTGYATFTDVFTADGITDRFNTSYPATTVTIVRVNDVTITEYTTISYVDHVTVVLNSVPIAGMRVVIQYIYSGLFAKAFTFGRRRDVVSTGVMSMVMGDRCKASGFLSYAEGNQTVASGSESHAENRETTASGIASHAEGYGSVASAAAAHAEGYYSEASGKYAHAEGDHTSAAENAHSEGYYSEASGMYSHAQNLGTIAAYQSQTAIGEYNVEDSNGDYVFIIGNGASNGQRSNAATIDWGGNMELAGRLTQSSDKRLKEHIRYLGDEATDFIRALKPVHYLKNGNSEVGFYAQDVEEADKWRCMVKEDASGYKTLGYTEIIAPLVAYCQKLESRIAELEKKLAEGE